jgi:hypothetical protein
MATPRPPAQLPDGARKKLAALNEFRAAVIELAAQMPRPFNPDNVLDALPVVGEGLTRLAVVMNRVNATLAEPTLPTV